MAHAAEMMVSPKRVLFADEVSTGLDSSTTYQLVRCMRNIVKMRAATVLMSLLQPPPETFELFDDVMLLSEGTGTTVAFLACQAGSAACGAGWAAGESSAGCAGRIVYHGPREHVLEFFEELGFRSPHRKGVADFLQASLHHTCTLCRRARIRAS